MKNKIKRITAYHYSNSKAYKSMRDKEIYGKPGLIPIRRFIRFGRGNNITSKAHDGVIEGLLEPEPKSWLENPKFPHLWNYLMHDICRENEVILLSFELTSKDDAYIVERAHIERELYRESAGNGKSTKKSMNLACKKYWESRVPALEYDKEYQLPQLAIWTSIEFERLRVEWIKPHDEVWRRVLKNNW